MNKKIILKIKKTFPVLMLMLMLCASGSYVIAGDTLKKATTNANLTFEAIYNIKDFGATTESINNASAIQQAIDKCTADGGGEVVIPVGTFVTGTIFLKDNVQLSLSTGAVLKSSNKFADYSANFYCLIACDSKKI